MTKTVKKARLIIASSESDANLYYATHFLVPDPVVYFEVGNKKNLVLSDLELDRGKQTASVDTFYSLTDVFKKIRAQPATDRQKNISPYSRVVDYLFKQKQITTIEVPSNFPSRYYVDLIQLGYQVSIAPDPFYPARLIKTTDEKKAIIHSIRQVESTLKEVVQLLEKSKIIKNKIYFGKTLITSEFLQTLINTKLMERNCLGQHTIVASGVQGSLPHDHGHGPIVPHTPIIFDIFPKHTESQYYADMTRTMVKGKPSDDVKKMFKAVLEANLKAQDKVKAGVTGAEVHQVAADVLVKHGYQTGLMNGRMQGYIHSTGHGLGLDVHESPSVSPSGGVLQAGNVITIEPGLYYEKIGGVRLEDDLYVTKTGHETLTKFPKFLEIDKAKF